MPGILDFLMPKSVHLRRIVRRMPHELVKRFGGGAYYTPGQVRRVAQDLGVRETLLSYAYAAACTRDDFAKAQPDALQTAYDELRRELVDTFKLPREEFNMTHLTAKGPSMHASEGGGM